MTQFQHLSVIQPFIINKLGDSTRKRASMQREIAPMKKEFADLEAKITARESKKEFLEAQLGDPDFFKTGDAQAAVVEHQKVEESLKQSYERWEELGKLIAEFESKLNR